MWWRFFTHHSVKWKMVNRWIYFLVYVEGEDRNEDVEDEEEGGRVDWTGQATKAREALLEADQTVSAKELHYRLLLENARTNAANSANQVSP